jgi:sarcosine oxidase
MKVAVIGVGGTGSASLRFLARAGHEAIGFEQFQIGHGHGSSHGESRIIRYAYPDEFHTRLMAQAYTLWDELETEAGQELFVRCGGITFGPRQHPEMLSTAAALQAAGLSYEELRAEAARERFPAIHFANDESAIYQSQSGFLRPTRCILANVQLAKNYGAQVRENTLVRRIENHGEQVLISTDTATESFDAVIVSAGAWIGQLLAPLNLPLSVEQRQIVYLRIANHPENFAPGSLPVWIDANTYYYGFPCDGVIEGIKCASHTLGDWMDLSEPRPAFEHHLQQVVDYARHRFPDLSDGITQASACLYTLTPDENFIVDSAPKLKTVHLVSGCSGHGFKWTVLLGAIAAQMATRQPITYDLSPWELARFSKEAF